jgi:hypothetical protein
MWPRVAHLRPAKNASKELERAVVLPLPYEPYDKPRARPSAKKRAQSAQAG